MNIDYKLEFFHSPKCYETCNSYCCNGFCNENFTFIKHDFVMLPLIEDEFNAYIKNGAIDGLKEARKIEKFTLRDGSYLKLFWLECHHHGLCHPHENRPLICKLYPFLPKVNLQGDIIDFMPATFFDLFFNDENHPCTLVRQNQENIKSELKITLKPLLKEPIYIFIFKACELIIKYIFDELDSKFNAHLIDRIPKEKLAEFYKSIELSLLLRTTWKNEKFFNEISDIYDEMVKIYGKFLPRK